MPRAGEAFWHRMWRFCVQNKGEKISRRALSGRARDEKLPDMAASLLIIDEMGALAERVDLVLRRRFRVSRVARFDEGVESKRFDVALIAPGSSQQASLCAKVRESGVASDVVVLASRPSLEETVVAIRAKASD